MKTNDKKKDLKIGIIGCGRMARVHLGYILENVPQENITICDSDEIKAEAFTEEFQIKEYFNDIEKMLTQFRPDICHVITPPHTHAEVAIKCMNQGSHVFIEKPMCTTVADADEIILISNKTQRLVCVGHQRLFEQPIIEAKRLIESGQFGSVVHVSAVDSNDSLELSKSGFEVSWSKNLPGGKFFDYLPHLVYLLEYFISGLNLQNAYYNCNDGQEISDLCASFASNTASGSLRISLSTPLLQNYLRIECTEGVIHIDSRNYVTFIVKKKNLPNAIERVTHNLDISYQLIKGTLKTVFLFGLGKLKSYEGTGKLINQFYTAVLHGEASPVPPEKGKEVVKLCGEIISNTSNQNNTKPNSDIKMEEGSKEEIVIKQKDARILVTGGTGFIGRHLVERLSGNGQKIRVISRCLNSTVQELSNNVEVIIGDVSDRKVVDLAMNGVEKVYHLAAATKGGWTQHLDTTVRGTKNILDSMVEHGVKKLVYVSSASVYDHTNYPNNGIIDEEFPYEKNPYKRGSYSNAKLKAEKLVCEYMKEGKLSACIIRPGMVYGSGRSALSVLPPHITLNTFKKTLILMGKGKKRLNLVYVENLVDALILAGENEKGNGCIFNIADREDATVRQYIKSYKHFAKDSFLTIYLPINILRFGFKMVEFLIRLLSKKELSFSYKLKSISKNVTYGTEKIEKVLGWRSSVSFEQAFKKTISAMRNQ